MEAKILSWGIVDNDGKLMVDFKHLNEMIEVCINVGNMDFLHGRPLWMYYVDEYNLPGKVLIGACEESKTIKTKYWRPSIFLNEEAKQIPLNHYTNWVVTPSSND